MGFEVLAKWHRHPLWCFVFGVRPHSPQQLPSKKEKGNAWGMFLHNRSQVWLEETPAAIKAQVKLDFVSISMFR